MPDRLRAYLELCRLSNLPTTFSNVLVGAAAGAGGAALPWGRVAACAGAVAVFYAAGMALNDVVDAEIDSRERPDRPIPSGRIRRSAAFAFGAACMLIGIGVAAALGLVPLLAAAFLAFAIVAYDVAHKKRPESVVLMGSCRGLVYLLGASAVGVQDWTVAVALAFAITAYIVVLTIVARVENSSSAGVRRWSFALLPPLVLWPALFVEIASPLWALIAGLTLTAWLLAAGRHLLREPARIRNAILAWLAGICLVDAYFLALLDRPDLSLAALALFGLTAAGHRHILGT